MLRDGYDVMEGAAVKMERQEGSLGTFWKCKEMMTELADGLIGCGSWETGKTLKMTLMTSLKVVWFMTGKTKKRRTWRGGGLTRVEKNNFICELLNLRYPSKDIKWGRLLDRCIWKIKVGLDNRFKAMGMLSAHSKSVDKKYKTQNLAPGNSSL